MKSLLFTFICILQFASSSLIAETIKFDIMLWGDKIGEMKVIRETTIDGGSHYKLISNTSAKFLWVKRVGLSEFDAWYDKNGKLLRSAHKEFENGKLKRFSNVIWDGNQYQVDNYKGKKQFKNIPVDDILNFYFGSKPETNTIYYQPEAEIVSVKQKSENIWYFKSSDGQTNIYEFENGKIKSCEFQLALATVKMIRV